MLEIRGNNNIEKIYGLMYEDDGFYLKRKKNKFNDFNNMLTTLTKRNLSNKIIDDILEYYNMKIKQSEIANILKIPKSSVRTVIQRLRKNGKIV
jgi:DNA-binding MarR family transcriptional regulator